MASSTKNCYDVVIIGAGISGLTAGWELKRAGFSVCILEANSRAGGRIFGFNHGHRTIQLGGRWTGPGQDAIKELAQNLGVSIVDNTVFESTIDSKYSESTQLVAAVKTIDDICTTIPLDEPWNAPNALCLDSQTLHSWLHDQFTEQVADTIGLLLCAFLPEPQDVSFLHAAFYLQSNGGLSSILGLDGPAHDSEMFEGGAHRICERLTENLFDEILFESPVYAIDQAKNSVHAHTPDMSVTARYAIVTVPPCLVSRIAFNPPLPAKREYFNHRFPIRGKISAVFLYHKPFWRELGKQLIYTDNIMCWDEGGNEQPYALAGLVSIPLSRELTPLRPESRLQILLDELSSQLGPEAQKHCGYHEVNWAEQPWSRGCNSYATTGAWTAHGQEFRIPFGQIYWAGAESSPVFVGQMDGAVRSAGTAVDSISSQLDIQHDK